MKKLALTLLAFTLTTQTILASDFNLIINGEVSTTASPTQQNGTTLVPVRFVSEQLGGQVDWDATTETVTITKDGVDIELKVGSTNAKINGQSSTLTLAPTVQNGTTMIPLRFVSEALDVPVDWDADTSTVLINSDKADLAKLPEKPFDIGKIIVNSKDDDMLYLYIFEALGENGASSAVVESSYDNTESMIAVIGKNINANMFFHNNSSLIGWMELYAGSMFNGVEVGKTTLQEAKSLLGGTVKVEDIDEMNWVHFIELDLGEISIIMWGETSDSNSVVERLRVGFDSPLQPIRTN
ncbi:MAG: hypothetical protein ATN35_09730 [Epulopiscium sp. Nele67-Bin004]|nr:MAG: hypothetical protein ATN35_09730 [Epulopiscium sp. Nele67-Bin004]